MTLQGSLRFLQHCSLALVVSGFAAFTPSINASETRIGPSGNPLPRFVSISATKARMRTGPGTDYPIDWVYNRRYLPLEVVDEHGAWRKVRDQDGITGWMLVSLLSGKRTAMLTGRGELILRHKPEAQAPIIIIAEEGVVGQLEACEQDWCKLDVDGESGWIERTHLWGVYPDENID